MKIAQIAPLMESCPPQLYGGTERVVSYLTEELVRQGHDVILFASGDLISSARLEACCGRALRLDANVTDPVPDHLIMLDKVRRMAEQFDILHFHVDILHYPLAVAFAARTITTMHGQLDIPELRRVHAAFRGFPLVSISNDQRLPMPPVKWAEPSITVFHAICFHSTLLRRADISRFWDASPRKSGPTLQSKSPRAQERD